MEDPNLPVILSSEEEDMDFAHRAPTRENNPVIDKHGKKRPSASTVGHKGTEVQDMLEDFGADINSALRAKKNRMEEYTKASFKSSNKKFEQVCEAQQQQIQKFYDDYSQKFKVVFQQCDLDMQKSKEQLGKLADSMQKHQEDFLQSRSESIQHLNTIRQVHLKFMQSLQNLEENSNSQLTGAESELKKEITIFKDKIMMDTISYTANCQDRD